MLKALRSTAAVCGVICGSDLTTSFAQGAQLSRLSRNAL
jgi:hypothetical protein